MSQLETKKLESLSEEQRVALKKANKNVSKNYRESEDFFQFGIKIVSFLVFGGFFALTWIVPEFSYRKVEAALWLIALYLFFWSRTEKGSNATRKLTGQIYDKFLSAKKP